MNLCAVIPAAGRGTRLGADRPKILVEVAPQLSIWNVLARNLSTVVDEFNVIVSPEGQAPFTAAVQETSLSQKVFVSLQPTPRGMGDAIFCGYDAWKDADNILVVWGDQVHVSQETLRACVTAHTATPQPHLTIPLVRLAQPYVEYVFDDKDKLSTIKQSREGDVCAPNGWGDVGTFLLSTKGLAEAWHDYIATQPSGTLTGELNFLPFMVYLSQQRDWLVTRVPVANPDEAKGINTPDDLAFFKNLYDQKNKR